MIYSLFEILVKLLLIIHLPILMIGYVIYVLVALALIRVFAKVIKKVSKSKYRSSVVDENGNTSDEKSPYFTIGILHPFCNSGGGGERVLWSAIKAIQDRYELLTDTNS